MKAAFPKLAGAILLLAGLFWMVQVGGDLPTEERSARAVVGNVNTLVANYQRWKSEAVRRGADRKLVLPLGYSKGLSAEFSNARGFVMIDLVGGSLTVEVTGLSGDEAFDVWLIDNRPGPGHSVRPEHGDVMVRVGTLTHQGGTARLDARLDEAAFRGFKLDLVAVARATTEPRKGGLLFGSPSLFQRLYYGERQGLFGGIGAVASSSPGPADRGFFTAPFQLLVPTLAHAQGAGGKSSLEHLIKQGEDLFFNGTFEGNGRTCGTCHPAANNLTIDPDFIATLACEDPLFVAEHAADPSACPGAPLQDSSLATLERPTLMRLFGLILENLDGFDDLKNKFVMRGVPHTLALGTSVTPPPDSDGEVFDGTTVPPDERTGWSGDGAPGDGSLRSFPTGAVIQHFTKTLNRVAGMDFQLPTDEELNAMEAFMLSLGRAAELDLGTMTFTDPDVSQGLALFNGPAGQCFACHFNAGANFAFGGGNANFNTGIEEVDIEARKVEKFPLDGGFGTECVPQETQCNPKKGPFGNGTFNTPTLVEAADTGPFFHNNAFNTIEEAVDFYTSDEFANSPSGQFITISLNDQQVDQVAALLRVINALENIRAAIALKETALTAKKLEDAEKPLRLAMAEIQDAVDVLQNGPLSLHPNAVIHLEQAIVLCETASETEIKGLRNQLIKDAIAELEAAREEMVMVDG